MPKCCVTGASISRAALCVNCRSFVDLQKVTTQSFLWLQFLARPNCTTDQPTKKLWNRRASGKLGHLPGNHGHRVAEKQVLHICIYKDAT